MLEPRRSSARKADGDDEPTIFAYFAYIYVADQTYECLSFRRHSRDTACPNLSLHALIPASASWAWPSNYHTWFLLGSEWCREVESFSLLYRRATWYREFLWGLLRLFPPPCRLIFDYWRAARCHLLMRGDYISSMVERFFLQHTPATANTLAAGAGLIDVYRRRLDA